MKIYLDQLEKIRSKFSELEDLQIKYNVLKEEKNYYKEKGKKLKCKKYEINTLNYSIKDGLVLMLVALGITSILGLTGIVSGPLMIALSGIISVGTIANTITKIFGANKNKLLVLLFGKRKGLIKLKKEYKKEEKAIGNEFFKACTNKVKEDKLKTEIESKTKELSDYKEQYEQIMGKLPLLLNKENNIDRLQEKIKLFRQYKETLGYLNELEQVKSSIIEVKPIKKDNINKVKTHIIRKKQVVA